MSTRYGGNYSSGYGLGHSVYGSRSSRSSAVPSSCVPTLMNGRSSAVPSSYGVRSMTNGPSTYRCDGHFPGGASTTRPMMEPSNYSSNYGSDYDAQGTGPYCRSCIRYAGEWNTPNRILLTHVRSECEGWTLSGERCLVKRMHVLEMTTRKPWECGGRSAGPCGTVTIHNTVGGRSRRASSGYDSLSSAVPSSSQGGLSGMFRRLSLSGQSSSSGRTGGGMSSVCPPSSRGMSRRSGAAPSGGTSIREPTMTPGQRDRLGVSGLGNSAMRSSRQGPSFGGGYGRC